MRSAVAGHQKLTMTDDSAITEADPLITTLEVTQELNIYHSTVIWHSEQIGKVKKFKWLTHELTINQNLIILKCCLLLFYATTNHFSIGL